MELWFLIDEVEPNHELCMLFVEHNFVWKPAVPFHLTRIGVSDELDDLLDGLDCRTVSKLQRALDLGRLCAKVSYWFLHAPSRGRLGRSGFFEFKMHANKRWFGECA